MAPVEQAKKAIDWLGIGRFGWMIVVVIAPMIWWAAWELSSISNGLQTLNESVVRIESSVQDQDKKFDTALEDRHQLGESIVDLKARLNAIEQQVRIITERQNNYYNND